MSDDTPNLDAPDDAKGDRSGGVWGKGITNLWREARVVVVLTAVLWAIALGQMALGAFGLEGHLLLLASLYPPAFKAGFWWTLLTHMFLHGGLLHIAFNSSALVGLGPAVAHRLGRDVAGAGLFLAFFVLCGLAGGAVFLALHWNGQTPAVGASGAICGLWGAVARMTPTPDLAPIWSRQVGRQTWSFAVMNVVIVLLGGAFGLLSGDGPMLVAWEAHVGGFIAGLFLISIFPMRYWWLREPQAAA